MCSLATSEEVAEYGVKRLSLAILYFIAVTKTSPEQRGDIHFELLRIEIMRDGKSMKLPLKKVSVAELEAATAALGKPAKKAKKSPAAKEIEAAVKGVKGVKANVTKTQFLVRGPIEGLKAVGLTLAKVDVPNG